MSSLPGNPHFEDANLDGNVVDYRRSQAILALAFEQRTSNIIELMRMQIEFQQVGATLEDDAIAEIESRMGLREAGS